MVCIIDGSNYVNISYSIFIRMEQEKNGKDYVIKEEDLGFFWHLFIMKIKDFFTSYKELVFCFEGLNSTKWRKEVYPLYKENRAQRKEDPNYKFLPQIYKQTEEFLSLFHCKVMRVEDCEADDCIYALSEIYTKKGDQVLIASSDKDLVQIMNYFEGVTVYSPIKRVNQQKDENILLEKAICGDSSDNISGVHGVGPKTLEKMLSDKAVWNKKMTPENMQVYKTILKIVDLREYPKKYHDKIVDYFNTHDYNKFNPDGVENFYLKYGLLKCQSEWSELCGNIEMLLNGNAEISAEKELEDLLK